MNKTTPKIANLWKADEVAECIGGLPDHLYDRLWEIYNETASLYTPEEQEILDNQQQDWWNMLTEKEQDELGLILESMF
mgnify:CR=1 FL=1